MCGGCTINLVVEEAVEMLTEELVEKYMIETGLDLTVYIVNSEDGTRIV